MVARHLAAFLATIWLATLGRQILQNCVSSRNLDSPRGDPYTRALSNAQFLCT
jgi:hypothetical protein